MKDRKKKTFIFRGLGFPVKLINVPMKKMAGEWVLDINFNKLQSAVLETLIKKPTSLRGEELKFIRKYLNLSTTEFGKIFGVSHVSVVKWESGKMHANLSTEVCIRLYVFDHMKAKDKDFRNFYHEFSPEVLSKNKKQKSEPIVIDDFDQLRVCSQTHFGA
jgi:DNA-binding transcriptional regulator YiaG